MSSADELAELKKQISHLTVEVDKLHDVQAIRKLQFAYGYYLDKCLYEEVVDLFSATAEVHFMGGVFKGRAGIQRLYIERFRKRFTGGHNGPVFGFLLDHMILQDIIDVAPDRGTAQARFRVFMQAGSHESRKDRPPMLPLQWWEGGVYENLYAREAGVWKIQVLNYRLVYQGTLESGWAHLPPQVGPFFKEAFPADPAGPDELTQPTPAFWPSTDVVPFHYAHPVTGRHWTAAP
jgi:hypothetical protein